jgi:hypothetical protein
LDLSWLADKLSSGCDILFELRFLENGQDEGRIEVERRCFIHAYRSSLPLS